MDEHDRHLKFPNPTQVPTLGGRIVTVQGDIYRSSKEAMLLKYGEDPALLRFYVVTFQGDTVSQYMNEIELVALIGAGALTTLGEE